MQIQETAQKPFGYSRSRSLVISFLVYSFLSVRLEPLESYNGGLLYLFENLFGSFKSVTIIREMLIPLCYLLLRRFNKKDLNWYIRAPAVLFSLSMVFGYAFKHAGNWNWVVTIRNGQALKAFLLMIGWYLLFVPLIAFLYRTSDSLSMSESSTSSTYKRLGLYRRYLSALDRHPFLTSFSTMLIAYIPYIFVCRPGIFMWDVGAFIVQYFPELKDTGITYLNQHPEIMLSPNVYINQHHPIGYTFLLHIFLVIGNRLFHSFNAGMFLYSLSQAIFFLSSFSYAIQILLQKRTISLRMASILVLYSIFHPMLHNYLFLVSKETLYAALLLCLIINLYRITTGENNLFLSFSLFLLSVITFMIRNESRYLLPVAYLVSAYCVPRLRKSFSSLSCLTIIFSVFVFQILFPALSFTTGSIREMLSVPIQQTARYIRDYGDEVTAEEREAINGILDFNSLADRYLPIRADDVKNTFKENASKEALTQYLRVWFSMLRKHPGTYIQAFLHMYHEYFFPVETRIANQQFGEAVISMQMANRGLEQLGQSFSYPDSTYYFRANYHIWNNWICSLPLFSFLMTPGVYGWTLLLIIFYSIRCKAKSAISVLSVPTVVWLVCFLSPANAYYGRYLFPVVVLMPFLIPMVLALSRNDSPSAGKENP